MTCVVLLKQAGRVDLRIVVDNRVEFGRDCDGVLVVDERVSRRHLLVEVRAGKPWVSDLGSSNGSSLNDTPLTAPVLLTDSDSVRFGGCTLTLSQLAPRPTGGTTRTIVGGDPSGGIRRTSIEHVVEEVDQRTVSEAILSLGPGDDTVTIMFSDIESSTEKNLALGDAAWIEVLQNHNDIVAAAVTHYGGTIIKNQGDGYMITFGSARRALLCCAHVQRGLHEWSASHADGGIRVRMGLHTGEAIHSDGDLFGRHVVIAARIANLAMGGQVLVSSIVRDITSARGDLSFGDPVAVVLKGVDGDHFVSDFGWAGAPAS